VEIVVAGIRAAPEITLAQAAGLAVDNVLRAELEVESSHNVSICKVAPAALSWSTGIRNTLQSRRLPRVMEKVSSIANTGCRNVLALTVINTSWPAGGSVDRHLS
jgi:hypothetical protein